MSGINFLQSNRDKTAQELFIYLLKKASCFFHKTLYSVCDRKAISTGPPRLGLHTDMLQVDIGHNKSPASIGIVMALGLTLFNNTLKAWRSENEVTFITRKESSRNSVEEDSRKRKRAALPHSPPRC